MGKEKSVFAIDDDHQRKNPAEADHDPKNLEDWLDRKASTIEAKKKGLKVELSDINESKQEILTDLDRSNELMFTKSIS